MYKDLLKLDIPVCTMYVPNQLDFKLKMWQYCLHQAVLEICKGTFALSELYHIARRIQHAEVYTAPSAATKVSFSHNGNTVILFVILDVFICSYPSY